MMRGLNRERIFEKVDAKKTMLNFLAEKVADSDVGIYAYCIMDNHIHLYTAMLIYGIIMINKEKGDVAMSFDIQISNSANGNIAKVTETSSKIRNKGKSLLELPDSYIVIDIETTGYLPYIDDIIEPAATRVKLVSALEMLMSKSAKRPAKKHGNIPL